MHFDVACLAALSVVRHQRGAAPLLASSAAAPDAAGLWLRVLVVAWWLLSARVVVGVLYFALSHNRRYRSAKLAALPWTVTVAASIQSHRFLLLSNHCEALAQHSFQDLA